nr:hypothetical protein [Tanacetum cinerariifolium]
MSSGLFFYTSSDDEDEVNSELAIFTEACQATYEASKPKIQRTSIERDCYGAHDRLVTAYFSKHPRAVPDSLDEYLQMGATTTRDSLRIFCKDKKHGFPEMLGSSD